MIQEGDKQAALQQLHGVLDASIRRDEGYKLHAIGLQNFYLQMADPSLETFEALTVTLMEMPFDEISRLQSADYNVGFDPDWFFEHHGVEISDREKLMAGVRNSGSLVQFLARRFDSETGELRLNQDIDPKTLAQEMYQEIEISISELHIKLASQDVREEQDLASRYQKGFALKDQILAHLTRYPHKFYNSEYSNAEVEPSWGMFVQAESLFAQTIFPGGGFSFGEFRFQEDVDAAEGAILRFPFEKNLEALPRVEKQRFDELRHQFGAKAANLIILSEIVEGINGLREDDLTRIQIPEFQVVTVDLFGAWNEGELSDDQIRPYFEWANGLMNGDEWSSRKSPADYIVRSSALYSEDGENVTGAGIYESIIVHAGSTFEDFKEAVSKVYASTDSQQAREYREQHGIDGEAMGLVIQKYIPSTGDGYGKSNKGYINSRLTGVPQLIEVVTQSSRNFVKRDALDSVLSMPVRTQSRAFRNIQHFLPDMRKIDPDLPVKLGQLTLVLERIWGKNVQVEFVADGFGINVVQVRELPDKALGQEVLVEFPDQEPIHSGASIGIGDMVLDVLDNEAINYEKSGVVVLEGNRKWTLNPRTGAFPKEGAVVVAHNDGLNGHIQTLAAEIGLICIFPGENRDEKNLSYEELQRLRKVRVVSNGMEARMYAVDGEKDSAGQESSGRRQYWTREDE